LPPCAGGPIPDVYARKGEVASSKVKMKDDDSNIEGPDKVKKERTKKNLELYSKAF
jgi:hypothetical protein